MGNQSHLQVRRASIADVEVISTFNVALAEETEGRSLDLPLLQAGIESLLRDPQKGWYAVVTPGSEPSKIIGQLLITFEWSDWRNGNFWWLQSLYVDQPYRQQGVFRRLYDYVYAQAQASPEKVCGFRLYVEQENHLAQQTYVHIGFHKTPYQMYELELLKNCMSLSPSTLND